jgi:hypothetical protein
VDGVLCPRLLFAYVLIGSSVCANFGEYFAPRTENSASYSPHFNHRRRFFAKADIDTPTDCQKCLHSQNHRPGHVYQCPHTTVTEKSAILFHQLWSIWSGLVANVTGRQRMSRVDSKIAAFGWTSEILKGVDCLSRSTMRIFIHRKNEQIAEYQFSQSKVTLKFGSKSPQYRLGKAKKDELLRLKSPSVKWITRKSV